MEVADGGSWGSTGSKMPEGFVSLAAAELWLLDHMGTVCGPQGPCMDHKDPLRAGCWSPKWQGVQAGPLVQSSRSWAASCPALGSAGGSHPVGSPPGSPPSPGCAVGPGLQCWWKQRPPNWFGPFQTLPLSLSGFKGLLLRPTHPNTLPANPRGSPRAPKSLPPQLCPPSSASPPLAPFRSPRPSVLHPWVPGGSEDAVGGMCWTVAVGVVGPMGFLSITEVAETRLRCPGRGSRTPRPPTAP